MSFYERLIAMPEEKRLNTLENLPSYLTDMGQAERLHTLLTTYDFLKAKVDAIGIEQLLDDYKLAKNLEVDLKDRTLQRIADAVRAGVVLLKQAPEELWNQVKGRADIALRASHPRPVPRLELRFPTLLSADDTLLGVFAGHTEDVYGCAFSPDGREVLSTSADHTLRLWDVANGTTLRVFRGHTDSVIGCAFSPNGREVLSASEDHTLRLWDVASEETLCIFRGHSGPVLWCVFSPDGRQVLSASGGYFDVAKDERIGDTTLRLWDVASGETLRVFEGHTLDVYYCAFSPDGKLALSASLDKTLRLWDVSSGETLHVFKGHREPVNACVFSPDGGQALSASGSDWGYKDYTLRLWDVASATTLRVFEGHTEAVFGCAFSPDGKQALSASKDCTLRLWDVASGTTLRIFEGHTQAVFGCTFSPDGRQVLSTSFDNTLRLWDVASATSTSPFEGHTDDVSACTFSPDGRQALSASHDGTLRLWDVASATTLRVFKGETGALQGCAFSPDGRQVLSSPYGLGLRLWDVASGKTLRNFSWNKWVRGCAFSPDGRQVLGSSYGSRQVSWNSAWAQDEIGPSDGGILVLWDVASGRVVRIFEIPENNDDYSTLTVYSVLSSYANDTHHAHPCAFSLDGKQVLGAPGAYFDADSDHVIVDKTMRLWDVATGQLVRTFIGHRTSVTACAFSPNGNQILSAASEDPELRLWDVASGKTLQTFEGHTNVRMRHPIMGCAFSPNGKQVLSASGDGILQLWDRASGHELTRWKTDTKLWCCAISPDGLTAVTGDDVRGFHFLSIITQ